MLVSSVHSELVFLLLKAYCKIDGVPTDILITGNIGQNRAVSLVYLLHQASLLKFFFALHLPSFSFLPMLERFYFSSLLGFTSSYLSFFLFCRWKEILLLLNWIRSHCGPR